MCIYNEFMNYIFVQAHLRFFVSLPRGRARQMADQGRGHGELAPNVGSAKNCLTIGVGYNKAQGARQMADQGRGHGNYDGALQEAAVAADPPGGGDGIKRPCKRIDDWVRGRGKWASRGRLMHSISSR